MDSICCYDPTTKDTLSKVRGVGRYLQILKENFSKWKYINKFEVRSSKFEIFINPFLNFLQPPLTLRRIAKKQIAVIHDLIPLKYPKHFPAGIRGNINILLNKLTLKNYDLIVTDSHTSKNDIVKLLKVKEKRVIVIYPCLPKIFSRPESGIRNQFFNNLLNNGLQITDYCIYVGDATWNKNLVNLAKAIKKINVNSIFVGKVFDKNSTSVIRNSGLRNNWLKEYKDFSNEIYDDKRFNLLGYVPDEQLIQLYQNAKCNLLVSRDEGFGFSYLEAASQGCPTVLSNIPVLREISKNKGTLFTKTDDPNEIANSLGEVYFNQEVRNKSGKLAQVRSRFFSKTKFTNEFEKIINSEL